MNSTLSVISDRLKWNNNIGPEHSKRGKKHTQTLNDLVFFLDQVLTQDLNQREERSPGLLEVKEQGVNKNQLVRLFWEPVTICL